MENDQSVEKLAMIVEQKVKKKQEAMQGWEGMKKRTMLLHWSEAKAPRVLVLAWSALQNFLQRAFAAGTFSACFSNQGGMPRLMSACRLPQSTVS
jgi:hypothetical protein